MRNTFEYKISETMPQQTDYGIHNKAEATKHFNFKNTIGQYVNLYRRIFYSAGIRGEWKLYRSGKRNPLTLKSLVKGSA